MWLAKCLLLISILRVIPFVCFAFDVAHFHKHSNCVDPLCSIHIYKNFFLFHGGHQRWAMLSNGVKRVVIDFQHF